MRLAAILALGLLGLPSQDPALFHHRGAIHTKSGSVLLGILKPESIQFTSSGGETSDYHWSKVRGVWIGEAEDRLMIGPDLKTGRLKTEELTVETDLGEFTLKRAHILTVSVHGPAGPGKPAQPPAGQPDPGEPGPSGRLEPAAKQILETRPTDLFLDPTGPVWLFEPAANRLAAHDPTTLARGKQVVDVWQGFRGVRFLGDGLMVAFGSVPGQVSGGRIAVHQGAGRALAWSLALDFEVLDLQPGGRGRWLLMGRNPHPVMAIVDPTTRKVAVRWGGAPPGDRLLAAGDGRRWYIISEAAPSGDVRAVRASGPAFDDPLNYPPARSRGETPLGSPAAILGSSYLVSGSTVLRLSERPDDDLRTIGRLDRLDSVAADAGRGLIVAAMATGHLKVISVPDLVSRKTRTLGARLGATAFDPSSGRLFALTAPEFTAGVARPSLWVLVRFDLASELAEAAAEAAKSRVGVPAAPPATLEPKAVVDTLGGKSLESVAAPDFWKPALRPAHACPACSGKGQVKTEKSLDDGAVLRFALSCLPCNGTGKADHQTCGSCRGAKTIQLAGIAGAQWVIGEVACPRCAGAGLTPLARTPPPAEAGKPQPCSSCTSKGRVKTQRVKDGYGTVGEADCPSCHGKGKSIRVTCPDCRGTGEGTSTREFEVDGRKIQATVSIPCVGCGGVGEKIHGP